LVLRKVILRRGTLFFSWRTTLWQSPIRMMWVRSSDISCKLSKGRTYDHPQREVICRISICQYVINPKRVVLNSAVFKNFGGCLTWRETYFWQNGNMDSKWSGILYTVMKEKWDCGETLPLTRMFGQAVPCPHQFHWRAERPIWGGNASLVCEQAAGPLTIITQIFSRATRWKMTQGRKD
jgi:hypothetical protein